MQQTYVFAYGTLRAQTARGDLLTRFGEYIGEGVIQARLYEVAGYPGVVAADNPSAVVTGEVYRLRQPRIAWPTIDRYEGCAMDSPQPHEFERELTSVLMSDGRRLTAWVYFYRRDVGGLRQIFSGDYLNP